MNEALTNVEKVFNVAECIPIVGIVSSALRFVLAKVQLAVGIIFLTLGLVLTLLSQNQRQHSWVKLGVEHIMHGILNGIRGSLTFALGMYTYGIGNIICLVPNLIIKPTFSPVLRYGSIAS